MPLHPDYPVVTGDYRMTEEWSLVLPEKFNRRVEDGDLVLWRPALTLWIAVWGNDNNESMEQRLRSSLATANEFRNHQQIEESGDLVRLTYELPEEDQDRAPAEYKSISGYVFGLSGQVDISACFDNSVARTLGYQVIHSVRYVA